MDASLKNLLRISSGTLDTGEVASGGRPANVRERGRFIVERGIILRQFRAERVLTKDSGLPRTDLFCVTSTALFVLST